MMKNSSFDSEKAISFVQDKCKEIERYKLYFLLGDYDKGLAEFKDLLRLQNKDGGISYRFQEDAFSALGSTIMFFKDFLILNLHELIVDQLDKAVDFILSKQKEGGFFEESEEINKVDCAFWEATGISSNRIYCTATVIDFLIGTKNVKAESAISTGLDYLARKWNDETGFKSYPHALWNAIPSFIGVKGEKNPISKRGLEMLETFQLKNYPSSSLAWMIESFIHANLENHTFISKILSILLERQNIDGRWISEDGEEFDSTTTLTVLTILKRLGKL